jgi:hypothetical protein
VYGGLVDRVHDFLLCGVDPSLVCLGPRFYLDYNLVHLLYEGCVCIGYRETNELLKAASRPWIPSHHAFLYGPEFRASIASVCLAKVLWVYRTGFAS